MIKRLISAAGMICLLLGLIDIVIGEENLVSNPGFEEINEAKGMPVDWIINTAYPGKMSVTEDVENVHSGKRVVKCESIAPGWVMHIYSTDGIEVDPAKNYEFKVWAKGMGRFDFGFYEYPGRGKSSIEGQGFSKQAILSSEWQCFTVSYKPSINTTIANPFFGLSQENGYVYIDDVSLVEVQTSKKSVEKPVKEENLSVPEPSAERQGVILFKDDFENGDLTNWDTSGYKNDWFSILDNIPTPGNKALKVHLIWPCPEIGIRTTKLGGSDYVIDFDTWTEKWGSRISVNLRMGDFNHHTRNTTLNFARIWVDQNGKGRLHYSEMAIDNQLNIALARDEVISTPIDVFDGKSHHWKIIVNGPNIIIDIDHGKYKFTVPIEIVSVMGGDYRIGLSGLNQPTYYDNVVISQIKEESKVDKVTEKPRILQIRGPHFQFYRVEEAAMLINAEPIRISHVYFRYWDSIEKREGVTFFPTHLLGLQVFDIVIMNDMPIIWFKKEQLQMLRQYVEQGGSLLIIGGHNSFVGGIYKRPEMAIDWYEEEKLKYSNIFEEMLPIELLPCFDIEWLKPPLEITPVSGYFDNIDWENSPVVVWLCKFKGLKPLAKVFAKAGESPAIIGWEWGKGRITILATTCLGVPGKDRTDFWEWGEWPKVMADIFKWLMKKE